MPVYVKHRQTDGNELCLVEDGMKWMCTSIAKLGGGKVWPKIFAIIIHLASIDFNETFEQSEAWTTMKMLTWMANRMCLVKNSGSP